MGEVAEPLRERPTDSWFRQLNDGRVEIMCRAPNFRLRVSAPEGEAWEAVELFEKWTGLTVHSDRRPRRSPPVIPGQITLDGLTGAGGN